MQNYDEEIDEVKQQIEDLRIRTEVQENKLKSLIEKGQRKSVDAAVPTVCT